MTTKQDLFAELITLKAAVGEALPSQKWYERVNVGTMRSLVELYKREATT
jgi:hypothetical protein